MNKYLKQLTRFLNRSTETPQPYRKPSEQVITRLVERYNSRSRKDITSWRNALRQAENKETPRRVLLQNLYDDLVLDNHLSALIQARKLKLLSQKFKLVNKKTGLEEKDKARLLHAAWFYQFLDKVLDAIFLGHTLIQFGDMQNGEFTEVQTVPRRHVVPERGEFLIEQYDINGITYRGTTFMDWLIEVGDANNLGLLSKAAPNVLWKKNAQMAWSEYAEIFGMPIRIGKTTSRSQEDLDRMETMLQEMGTASYGVFQEGETIEFIESTKGDAYKVYDMLVDRCNKELSKLVLGATMVMDDGSSLSQSEVHERVTKQIVEADKRLVEGVINGQLFTLLNKHGYELGELEFVWDEREELSLAEQWTIDSGLLQSFDIEPEYFANKYHVPVKKKEHENATN